MDVVIKIEMSIRKTYTCATCGSQALGTPMFIKLSNFSLEELKLFIDRLSLISTYMPYGWSYNGKFNCGCNKE